MSKPKLFFITGVSTGFGRALAETALAEGHKVVGTIRKEADRGAFESLKPGHAVAMLLDVTDTGRIKPVIADVEARIGGIDVLVNNAGYGHEGVFEESSIEDLRHQFDVNVFGPAALMQAVLPYMRGRRSGHILNITSMGGFITLPGLSYYHGSKFALEGISEAVAKEVKDFGIHVTAVEPGGFRTDWAGRSMNRAPRSIPDYDRLFDPMRARRQGYSGKQQGDPAKAARAMLQLVDAQDPPMHLLLGQDALTLVREKMADWQAEIAAWEAVTVATGFQE
ncbi:MAG TPA: oxidoreductase [Stellaceae bacterium]|jgi:NAD(P)-dependent dehydrogenase (short-subunit alcohol dehydrogenase family)|nr:oxidoreductase [Stellaceae bacterium]